MQSQQHRQSRAQRESTHCAGILAIKALPSGGGVAPFDPAMCRPRAPQAAFKLLLGGCPFLIRQAAGLPAPCTLGRLTSRQPVITLLLVLVLVAFRRRHRTA